MAFAITRSKLFQVGTIAMCGDLGAQLIEHRQQSSAEVNIDMHRLLEMTTLGFFINGVLVPKWLQFIWRRFPGTDTKSVLKKIAADQIVFAPFTVCFYLPMTVLFQEFSEKKLDSSKPLGHKILDTVTTKGPPILMIDWMVWPVASFINFKYIPHKSQQLYYAVLSSLWTCFLSFMSWNEITEDEK